MLKLPARLANLAFMTLLLPSAAFSLPAVSSINAPVVKPLGTPATDCKLSFKKAGLCADIVWKEKPKAPELPQEKDKTTATLQFWDKIKGDKTGPYMSPRSKIHAKLWMPSMKHGSLPIKVVPQADKPGVYEIQDVLFSMPGDWEVQVKLEENEKSSETSKLPVLVE